MKFVKNLISKYSEKLVYFYKQLRYRLFLMIILGVIVGVLDGFGLAMFMPLLEMVNNPNEVSGSSLGKLKFLVNFMESFGISLNLATVLLIMIFFFVFSDVFPLNIWYYGIKGVPLHSLLLKRKRKRKSSLKRLHKTEK